MLGLFKRDFLVQRKRILLAAVCCVVLTALLRFMGEFALVPTVLMAVYFVLISAFEYDDKYKVDGTFISLPIKRQSLVLVRYLEVPVLTASVVLIYVLVTSLLNLWFPRMSPVGVLMPATGFLIASLMSGLYMPIIYRLGYVKAKIFNMAILLAFAMIPATVMVLGKTGGEMNMSLMNMSSWIATASRGMVASLMFAVAIVILVVSCLLSIRLYRKRQF